MEFSQEAQHRSFVLFAEGLHEHVHVPGRAAVLRISGVKMQDGSFRLQQRLLPVRQFGCVIGSASNIVGV